MTKKHRTFLIDQNAAEPPYRPGIMLDSGAFSAWWRDQPLRLADYIGWVHRYGSRFEAVVALDVIPGRSGRMSHRVRDYDHAARHSYENFAAMRKEGIDAIPVFHQGEDWKWLDLLIGERVPYVGISPFLKAPTTQIIAWLDKVFTRITDENGRPFVKTHGFGLSLTTVIQRYPWYSLDSTSWAVHSGFGYVIIPRVISGKLDYSAPQLFSITDRDEARRVSLVSCGPATRKFLDYYFDLCGTSFIDVRTFQEARFRVNALYYLGLANTLKSEPFHYRLSEDVFDIKPIVPFDYEPSVFLSTMVANYLHGQMLTAIEAPHRLISYFDARRFTEERINEYISHGYCVKARYNYKIGTKSYELRRKRRFAKRIITLEAEDLDE